MNPFTFERALAPAQAVALADTASKYLGGGTNLVDLMREHIERPAKLIDVTQIDANITALPNDGLLIGASTTNTAVASDARVCADLPVLAQAIMNGASGQIRNMATVAGNIMQRTRCTYFYDHAARCNKRDRHSGCDALNGFNRYHAILGASDHCVATHPSDMCVALSALEAVVHVQGKDGERVIAFDDFHRLPGDTPELETTLAPGELIVAVEVPRTALARRSMYRKVRDRASYAFALVSVAAAIDVRDGVVRDVRIALGGVAHKPWRARVAERELRGKPATETSFRTAATAELAQAKGLEHNAFKIDLVVRALVNVLSELAS